MPFATARGPRIYYELRGDAARPPLVLLRGLGRNARHWAPLDAALEADHHLVLVDNRGVGRSEAPLLPYDVADMADDVARVLDHADIARADVFGISLGGMIAQRLAIDHKARVDRLVLGATSPGGREARPASSAVLVSLMRARLLPRRAAIAAEARLLLGAAHVAEHPEVIDAWLAIDRELPLPAHTLALQLVAAARHDAAQELTDITAPTLILSAEHDPLIHPDNSRLMARRIRGAELAWLAGEAHDFVTARPRVTARLLRHFLSR
jgi:pimeloyl-ACP methyl ester carboxylesterase